MNLAIGRTERLERRLSASFDCLVGVSSSSFSDPSSSSSASAVSALKLFANFSIVSSSFVVLSPPSPALAVETAGSVCPAVFVSISFAVSSSL